MLFGVYADHSHGQRYIDFLPLVCTITQALCLPLKVRDLIARIIVVFMCKSP